MRRFGILLIMACGCGDSNQPVADITQGWANSEVKPGWGNFIDPDGDCKQLWKQGTLIIDVPATMHELQGSGRRNAPRLLLDRTGDFAMSVRAAGKLSPQHSTGGRFAPYHGAGILVTASDTSFVRLERAKISPPNGNEVTYINFEQHSASSSRPIKQFQLKDDESVFLRVERRGNKIVGLLSRNGTSWEILGETSLEASGALKVGVAAVNNSNAAFAPEFSEFRFFDAKKS